MRVHDPHNLGHLSLMHFHHMILGSNYESHFQRDYGSKLCIHIGRTQQKPHFPRDLMSKLSTYCAFVGILSGRESPGNLINVSDHHITRYL